MGYVMWLIGRSLIDTKRIPELLILFGRSGMETRRS